MTSYILAIASAAVFLSISSITSILIKYEGGAKPKDPKLRRLWFIIFGIINPVVFYLLGRFVLAPNEENNAVDHDDFIEALPVATAIGFVTYFVLGFVLSKMFKNGKLGNWF